MNGAEFISEPRLVWLYNFWVLGLSINMNPHDCLEGGQ